MTTSVLVALILAGGGCSTGGDQVAEVPVTAEISMPSPTTAAPTTDPPSGRTEPGDEDEGASPGARLERLVSADEDLLDGETSELREQGLQVVNQVTLDYCGFTFTTEKERLFRHQVNVYLEDTYVASSEAVLYSPGSAENAMNEVRQAMAGCPPGVAVASSVAGVPDLIYEAVPIPAERLTSLTSDHIAVEVTASTPEGQSQSTTMIYQRRGDVLVGTYGEQDRALPLAEAVAVRLAAASAEDVGA